MPRYEIVYTGKRFCPKYQFYEDIGFTKNWSAGDVVEFERTALIPIAGLL